MDSSNASYPIVKPSEIDGLVIHCSDPRFQKAFEGFIANNLGLKNPAKIVVPGGIHDLVSPVRVKAARQLWEQLEFMIKELKLRRVVIINHQDCKWYGKWTALVSSTVGEDVARHLLEASKMLASRSLGVDVETYLARIEGDNIVFDKVTG